jgi:hypothetical protein
MQQSLLLLKEDVSAHFAVKRSIIRAAVNNISVCHSPSIKS